MVGEEDVSMSMRRYAVLCSSSGDSQGVGSLGVKRESLAQRSVDRYRHSVEEEWRSSEDMAKPKTVRQRHTDWPRKRNARCRHSRPGA